MQAYPMPAASNPPRMINKDRFISISLHLIGINGLDVAGSQLGIGLSCFVSGVPVASAETSKEQRRDVGAG